MQAFGAESGRLAQVAEGAGDAAFGRLSPCRPWTAAELLYHVQMTMGRLQAMLAEPSPSPSPTARAWWRPPAITAPTTGSPRP